jgi:acetylglutamate kinase
MEIDFLSEPNPESLPTAKPFIGRTVVMFVGEETLAAPTLVSDLIFMRRVGVRPLVVHEAAQRSTGSALVGMINRNGGDAVGIGGASAHTLTVSADDTGNQVVRTVNAQLMELLLDQGYIPVFAAEGAALTGVPIAIGGALAARSLASAMHAIRLLFPARPGGVPSARSGIIDELTSSEALVLAAEPTLDADLRRELTEAALGVRSGVDAAQLLDLSSRHASIIEMLTARHVGTQVVSNIVLSR